MFERLFGRRNALMIYSWGFVLYLLGVILFGAWVRITHSGAGCGDHWPTCHGQVIPLSPSTETMIEFTHRVTSGMCGIFGLVLLVWTWIKHRASTIFTAALLTNIFILIEALLGAGLVLKELVADDDSVARAVVISLHLVNTLILMAAASLTAWWAGGRAETLSRLDTADHRAPSWRSPLMALWGVGVLAVIATCMSGAVTALGDTLFPVDPTLGDGLVDRVRDDLSPAKHFLVRLRILHPVVAIGAAAYTLFLGSVMRRPERPGRARAWALVLCVSVVAQVLVGLINIALAAPGWVQLMHLTTAQLVWISLLLLGFSAAGSSPSSS